MEKERPLILISNDDGVTAKGLQVLIDIIRPLGDIVVMAPDGGRSGCSCAVTVSQPVHFQTVSEDPGFAVYKCSGMPGDCIKLSSHTALQRNHDVVVCGLNHAVNSSSHLPYSSTIRVAVAA